MFVHSRMLNDCGFHSLAQGQKLLIKIDDAGKRSQVKAERLLNVSLVLLLIGHYAVDIQRYRLDMKRIYAVIV